MQQLISKKQPIVTRVTGPDVVGGWGVGGGRQRARDGGGGGGGDSIEGSPGNLAEHSETPAERSL